MNEYEAYQMGRMVTDFAGGLMIGILAAVACCLVFVLRAGYGEWWCVFAGCATGYGCGLIVAIVVLTICCALAFMPPHQT